MKVAKNNSKMFKIFFLLYVGLLVINVIRPIVKIRDIPAIRAILTKLGLVRLSDVVLFWTKTDLIKKSVCAEQTLDFVLLVSSSGRWLSQRFACRRAGASHRAARTCRISRSRAERCRTRHARRTAAGASALAYVRLLASPTAISSSFDTIKAVDSASAGADWACAALACWGACVCACQSSLQRVVVATRRSHRLALTQRMRIDFAHLMHCYLLSTERNIPFSNAHRRLTLDVHWIPQSGDEPKRPVLLHVHGGGWSTGNSQMSPPLVDYLAARGWIVFSVQVEFLFSFFSLFSFTIVLLCFSFLLLSRFSSLQLN